MEKQQKDHEAEMAKSRAAKSAKKQAGADALQAQLEKAKTSANASKTTKVSDRAVGRGAFSGTVAGGVALSSSSSGDDGSD